jgi:hypothetical protein
MLEYYAQGETRKFVDNIDWTTLTEPVVIDIDEGEDYLHITFADYKMLYVDWSKHDRREKEELHYGCNATQPYGCCCLSGTNNSGCGDELCVKHYPVQIIEMECNVAGLLNRKLTGLRKVSDEHEFAFILENLEQVPLTFYSNSSYFGLTMTASL